MANEYSQVENLNTKLFFSFLLKYANDTKTKISWFLAIHIYRATLLYFSFSNSYKENSIKTIKGNFAWVAPAKVIQKVYLQSRFFAR